jgi:hypothetical protein
MPAHRRRRDESEELPVVIEQEQPSREDTEVSDFLDSLGPKGITEVKLFRIERTGKQVFLTSGPPSQFSEQYAQLTFGAGDYMVRAYKDSKWEGSKNFSVGAPPGGAPGVNGSGMVPELERLKLELDAQRLRLEQQQAQMEADRREHQAQMEAERREREQRNHELQLKMFESLGGNGNRGNDTVNLTSMISGMIGGIKSLKDLSGNEPLAQFNQYLEAFERINALKGSGNGDGGSWWQPLVAEGARTVGEVARTLAPALPSIIAAGRSNAGNGVSVTSAPLPSPTVQTTPNPSGLPVNLPPGPPPGPPAATLPVGAGVMVPPASPLPSSPADPAVSPLSEVPPAAIPQPENAMPGQGEDVLQTIKKSVLGYLLQMARLGRDPRFHAEMALELVDTGDGASGVLLQELHGAKDFDSWFADLQKIDITVLTQRSWFSDFYQTVRSSLTEQMKDEAAT